MKMLAYAGARIFPWCNILFVHSFFRRQNCLTSKINDRKVVITFVATVLLGKFFKDVLTALIPSELGIDPKIFQGY